MLKKINELEAIFSALFLGAMAVVIIVQVVFRYFISYSLTWPEELGRFLFIASVYIGSSYAEKENKHLAITILRTNAGAWCAKYVPIIAQVITIIFCFFMTIWGLKMVQFMIDTKQLAPALLVPMYVIYFIIPIGMGLMCFRAVINLFLLIKEAKSK